ncbi:hypothetical protein KI387_020892 [Taxus chinensis]|uniref:Uncharacterized protein n=1 Tax=Taxus chinensis TaxID=29808 RepID=A0AA38GC54_TAXCH|nr:hypothetical protein KI387_020892 [Taxus chinensis]
MRVDIFKDNLRYIDERNQQNIMYVLGLNEFSDLSHEEFKSMYVGRIKPGPKNTSLRYQHVGDDLPSSVDWRKEGVVTLVKRKGCGDCWAFNTIASVEGINKIVTGELISLLEQQLDACVKGSNGCSGGGERAGFEYIINNFGIASVADYPYTDGIGVCNEALGKKSAVTIDGYENVPSRDEKSMKTAVAQQPVSVDIEVSGRDWSAYKSGIFTGKCGTSVNHGMTIVGYGSEDVLDYWIVKFAWGREWGEEGYIRMCRNVEDPAGMCGIALYPSYPRKDG